MPVQPVGPFVRFSSLPHDQQALVVAFDSPGGGNAGTFGAKDTVAIDGAPIAAWQTQRTSEFCAIQEGRVEVVCAADPAGGGTFVAGDCFLLPAGLVYSWRQSRPWASLSLCADLHRHMRNHSYDLLHR
jgi:hypothetical protein